MAQLGVKFDPTAHDTEQRDFENLPDGVYVLHVTASEVKATSKGDGTGLNLTYQVIEPEEFKDRKIFSWINLQHTNTQAQEIGQRELASLCRAAGISNGIEDSEELHFQRFTAKVGLGKPSTRNGKEYPARNEIKRFFFPDQDDVPEAKAAPVAANDNQPPAANDNTSATAPSAAAGGAKRPWKK